VRPSIAIALIGVAAAAGTGRADAIDQVAPAAGFPTDGIEIVEQLGGRVPLDVPLRDHAGNDVTLGELLAGDIPTILTFNYSSCPNLCSYQLNGLVQALPALAWRVGDQFRIVTIVLDPKETADRVRLTRDHYVARLPAGSKPAAWTFATTRTPGDGTPIRRIADAVGFRYEWVTRTASWGHPAALIFLSSRGVVTRYVHGVDYAKEDMIESITKAGVEEPGKAAGFLMRCFHWDDSPTDAAKLGPSLLRYAAAGFLVLLATAFGIWHLARRHRASALGDRP
jgi:protein SCO1/2